MERLERVQFTLNFEPGTLNGCYPTNVWNRLQYSLAVERFERFEQLERLELLERLEPSGLKSYLEP